MGEKYIEQLEIVKKYFNTEQFKELGIEKEEYKNKYLVQIAKALFYLQIEISQILMPYVAKIENYIKDVSGKHNLQEAINEIFRNIRKFFDDWPQFTYNPIKISNKNKEKTFIHFLYAFRVVRNIIMHGQKKFLCYYFNFKKDSKITRSKMIFNIYTEKSFKNAFNIFKKRTAFEFDEKGSLSYLAIILIVITFFIHKKEVSKIFAEIDYALFVFMERTQMCLPEKFWKILGLKMQWLKKII